MCKVVLISQAGSEGIDFKNIRQVHILEPWYNRNRLEQVIGRGIRNCSHKSLDPSERNVMIYQHGTLHTTKEMECVDMMLYRMSENKEIKIGIVKRLLKENSVDCLLNQSQNDYASLNVDVDQVLSSGVSIKHNVMDKPYSALCDYMQDCVYMCNTTKTLDEDRVNNSTMNKEYLGQSLQEVKSYLQKMFRDKHVYTLETIVRELMYRGIQKEIVLYSLNTICSRKDMTFRDKFNRVGYVRNVDYLFIFVPKYLYESNATSKYERDHPLSNKPKYFQVKVETSTENTNTNQETNQNKKKSSKSKTQSQENHESNNSVSAYDKIMKHVSSLFENYMTLFTELRGVTDEKKHYRYAMDKLKTLLGIEEEYIVNLTIRLIVERLKTKEILVLLNTLYLKYIQKDIQGQFESEIVRYFLDNVITSSTGKIGIYIFERPTPKTDSAKLYYYNDNDMKFEEAMIEDELEFKTATNEYIENTIRHNDVVGFVSPFKDNLVFKYRYMKRTGNKGARCDQAKKSQMIELFEKISGIKIETPKNYTQHEVCYMQEMVLRYYDMIKKNNRRWFFTTSEMTLYNKKNK